MDDPNVKLLRQMFTSFNMREILNQPTAITPNLCIYINDYLFTDFN